MAARVAGANCPAWTNTVYRFDHRSHVLNFKLRLSGLRDLGFQHCAGNSRSFKIFVRPKNIYILFSGLKPGYRVENGQRTASTVHSAVSQDRFDGVLPRRMCPVLTALGRVNSKIFPVIDSRVNVAQLQVDTGLSSGFFLKARFARMSPAWISPRHSLSHLFSCKSWRIMQKRLHPGSWAPSANDPQKIRQWQTRPVQSSTRASQDSFQLMLSGAMTRFQVRDHKEGKVITVHNSVGVPGKYMPFSHFLRPGRNHKLHVDNGPPLTDTSLVPLGPGFRLL